jgi:hypothetical protein
MPEGYIKLWRKSLDSPVWDNPKVWRFWTWCLMKASHKDIDIVVGYQNITLKPGQFIFGRLQASKETKLSEQSVRTCLFILKNMENISIKSTNKYSIISIVKWGDYQDTSTSNSTNKQPTNNQQTTSNSTNKNDMFYTQKDGILPDNQPATFSTLDEKSTTNKKNKKNNNKEKINKKESYGEFQNVFLTEEEYEKLKIRFNSKLSGLIENLSAGIESKGYKYKSHYATILTWARKDENYNSVNKKPAAIKENW